MKKGEDMDLLNKKTSLARKTGQYKLPKMSDNIKCPVCRAKDAFSFNRTIYNLPDGDEVLIILMECDKCNFKSRDILSLYSSFQPGEYHLTIDDGDFTHKIFRGSLGDIIIDDIGIEIERAESSRFEYTNIEGILSRIEEQVNFFLNTTPHDTREWIQANEVKKRLTKCMSGKMSFTLILKDPQGGSYIAPSTPDKMKYIPYKKENDNS